MLILSPVQILVFAIFYKDYGNEYYYRIFGHYKYNFSFTMVEPECIIGDFVSLAFDWLVVYIPHEMAPIQNGITLKGGRTTALPAYNVYQVLLL